MIDKCSCGATCAQVEALQVEVERLKAEIWDLRHQVFLLIGEESE